MNTLNKPSSGLKKYYPILFEIGLILVLTSFIAGLRFGVDKEILGKLLDKKEEILIFSDHGDLGSGKEFVTLEASELGRQLEISLPAPPRTRVITTAPDDEIVEDMDFEFDSEIRISKPEYIPVPLPSIFTKIGYFLGDHRLSDIEPGILAGMQELKNEIVYPEFARRAGIKGRVFVRFILNEQGKVEDPTVLRGIGGGCDEAVVNALKEARFWPGMIQGQPVRVRLTVFVEFRLIN
jgi:protein TonB